MTKTTTSDPPMTAQQCAQRGLDRLQLDEYELQLVDELRRAMTDKQAAAVAELLARGTAPK